MGRRGNEVSGERMIVLAHRALARGPRPELENKVSACRYCLRRGWGLEVDIRSRQDGGFYLSHDVLGEAGCDRDASALCEELRAWPNALVAVNIKELGYEKELVTYLNKENVLSQVVLFDMELLESEPGSTARRLRRWCPLVKVAARVSDRNEPLERALGIGEASAIWLDEFDGPWATEKDFHRLKATGRLILAVSPELHARSETAMVNRWKEFASWPVDGICTDYPERLESFLREGHA